MPPAPSSDHGPAAPAPASPGPQDGAWWPEADWDPEEFPARDADEWDLPPEWLTGDLTAGEVTDAGFAAAGRADTMVPGPVLSGLVEAAAGHPGTLAGLSDDELVGVIAAARRTEARAVWAGLAATAEFAARRQAPPRSNGCFGADELANRLNLTWRCAGGEMAYAQTVSRRLPRSFAALAAGLIHPVHLRIIADVTGILSDEDAALADEKLAELARGKTFGQLRSAAHRLVLKLDPDAVRRRKEDARRDARVRPFREESGNAGMTAREMPAEEVLASWQHVEQRALDLRAAGVPGTLQELRVRAYLDLLQERDIRTTTIPVPGPGTGEPAGPDHGPGGTDDGPGGSGVPAGSGGPAGAGPDGGDQVRPTPDSGDRAQAAPGPSVAALVIITVPLATLQGDSDTAGEAAGFGLLDAGTARDLVAAAARNAGTRWCVTALHPDGTAAAHACAAGRHPHPPDPRQLKFNAVIPGPCNHAQVQHAYRPSRKLRHLVAARNATCTAPGCSRPAMGCDLDHTTPWHHGGPTCPCNIAPLCRHHHRCKQAEGWWLEQPEPGILVWRTPTGRIYATTPTEYPI
jgi:hypothetical protein